MTIKEIDIALTYGSIDNMISQIFGSISKFVYVGDIALFSGIENHVIY
ncbi:MAG: hypothetical protein JSV31_29235 [Desulfobacterales bacterium]|nr:MAG: hypothetical protein JSV31_29235 [Desulfobacterales bacterium]